MQDWSILRDHLEFLYDGELTGQVLMRLRERIEVFRRRYPQLAENPASLSQQDAILITYGDQVRQADQAPLQTLADFARSHLTGVVNGLHLLPFYPSSSDDGFAVIDYRAVDPHLGGWQDIAHLGVSFRLMFDGVINHISAQSEWFQSFLGAEEPYTSYFITVDPSADLSKVVRPRALPLLTRVETALGPQHVWTTFSDDQIDLNYANPDVLLEIVDLLLYYVARGATFIRLDAIAYLWKEIGTSCIHLPQTHRVIQLMRAILDRVAPYVLLITETNVPHVDNISYFGDGGNEAQLVYNFALPPLTLHTLQTGDAQALSIWAAGLETPSTETTFFNFLASHDGIGLNPAAGILAAEQIEALVARAKKHGGEVSYKTSTDGSESPYELNINYFDALSDPQGGEHLALQVERFVCAHAIMLSLAGVPGIYFHSLFGSRSWPEGVALTGRKRTINRQKLERPVLEQALADHTSLRYGVYSRLAALLRTRAAQPAFHPFGDQQVIDFGPAVFGLLRTAPQGSGRALCLHNVSRHPQEVALDLAAWGAAEAVELTGGLKLNGPRSLLSLQPYQTAWFELLDH